MDRTSVPTDSTFYFNLTSRNTSNVPTQLLGSPAAVLYENNSDIEITGAVGISSNFDSVQGLNQFSVNTTTAGIEPGKHYSVVMSAGTVGGTSVVGQVVYEFTMESAAEKAQRLYRTYLYPESTLGASASHSTTIVDMTGILDAQTPADAVKGVLYAIRDATDGRIEYVHATALTATTLLMTVERVDDRGVMSFTPASGDDIWPVGMAFANTMRMNGAGIVGDGNATPWDGA